MGAVVSDMTFPPKYTIFKHEMARELATNAEAWRYSYQKALRITFKLRRRDPIEFLSFSPSDIGEKIIFSQHCIPRYFIFFYEDEN